MYRESVASSRSRGSIGSFNSLALLSGTGNKLKINKIIGATFRSYLNSKLSHKNSDSSASSHFFTICSTRRKILRVRKDETSDTSYILPDLFPISAALHFVGIS